MKKISDPIRIGTMQLKNRIVRGATLEAGGADDGEMNDLLGNIYTDLAKGGVGLIITGMMGVGPNSCAYPSIGMTRIYGKTFGTKFRKIADRVHQYGAKIAVELGQCGARAVVLETREHPYCPSDHTDAAGNIATAMTKEEIARVVEDFGTAAAICKESGADAVEIHAAHGYLLSEFLSPYFNKREDEYGGSIENRCRIVKEAYTSVRAHVGEDFPVLIKINYEDLVQPGLTGAECLVVCQQLEALGIDAIEISTGLSVSMESAPFQRPKTPTAGTFTQGALKIADSVSIPVISIGGYRTIEGIENVLNEGNLTAISMSRPFICEPDLIARWLSGDTKKAKCVSCNKCFTDGGGFGCKVFRKK